ncbi:hypothetical protein OPV22_019228 [Ensete ventricosum]|uniref:Uncharacterized protein n=1 Tax=Ensete ventricosum TaxID=4639 RepID=A0AAV8PAY7_ENSVE|nr:hypothetical protein OPV22_019228 [Ensete ventricosum]
MSRRCSVYLDQRRLLPAHVSKTKPHPPSAISVYMGCPLHGLPPRLQIARDSWRRRWLNHKGYRTGNLRNIDNVWKAGQKHDAQQLLDERDTSHFRLVQWGSVIRVTDPSRLLGYSLGFGYYRVSFERRVDVTALVRSSRLINWTETLLPLCCGFASAPCRREKSPPSVASSPTPSPYCSTVRASEPLPRSDFHLLRLPRVVSWVASRCPPPSGSPLLRTVSTGETASFRGFISDAVTVSPYCSTVRGSSEPLPRSDFHLPLLPRRCVLGRFSLSSVRERLPSIEPLLPSPSAITASSLRPRLRTVSTGETASFRGLISDAVTVSPYCSTVRSSSGPLPRLIGSFSSSYVHFDCARLIGSFSSSHVHFDCARSLKWILKGRILEEKLCLMNWILPMTFFITQLLPQDLLIALGQKLIHNMMTKNLESMNHFTSGDGECVQSGDIDMRLNVAESKEQTSTKLSSMDSLYDLSHSSGATGMEATVENTKLAIASFI